MAHKNTPAKLVKELKVTKTQAVLAGVERYKQRQQKLIDAADFEKVEKKFRKVLKASVSSFQKSVRATFCAELGIKPKQIRVGISRDDIRYMYVEVEINIVIGTVDQSYDISNCYARYPDEENVLSTNAQNLLMHMRQLVADYDAAKDNHKRLMASTGADNLATIRKQLKHRLQSTQQLSDMQVAQALIAQKSHREDIDAVLDELVAS